jgi:hypothetical protein
VRHWGCSEPAHHPLGMSDRVELTRYAIRRGLVSPDRR